MKKIILYLFIIFGITPYCFAANNATDIYLLAQTKSTSELGRVENIDAVDADGNTALCSAIRDNNIEAYNLLKSAGANTGHQCVRKIPTEQYKAFTQKLATTSKSWSFLEMGKWAWTAIGAGVVAGGAAAAMGGGGGSSSGGDSTSFSGNTGTNTGEPNTTLSCQEQGYTYQYADSCPDGWVKNNNDYCNNQDNTGVWFKCNIPQTCSAPYYIECANGYEEVPGDMCLSGTTVYKRCVPITCTYQTTSCTGGYQETGNTCQSGNTLYKECEPIQCGIHGIWSEQGCICNTGWTGNLCDTPTTCPYPTTSCSYGYIATENTCQSGDEIYVECVLDTENYIEQNGQVYPKLNCIHGNQVANSCSCENGWIGNLCDTTATCTYQTTSCTGMYQETGNTCQSGDTLYKECEPIQCGVHATWTSTGCICDSGYGNWQQETGCFDISDCGSHAHSNGSDCVCEPGYKNWTYSTGFVGCVPRNDVTTRVIDNSTSQQDIYGEYNTQPYFSTINISNSTDSNVHGIFNNQPTSDIKHYGTIYITNEGQGNVYGIKHINKQSNDTSNSGRFENSSSSNDKIIINNTGDGDVYGIYSETDSNYTGALGSTSNLKPIYRDTTHNGGNFYSQSTIDINNTGDGNVYGMWGRYLKNTDVGLYSSSVNFTDYFRNISGKINIENNGIGNAYGMYVTGGTTVYVSANATYGNGYITILNQNNGDAYGMFGGTTPTYNAKNGWTQVRTNGYIRITNNDIGNVYGMYGQTLYNAYGVETGNTFSPNAVGGILIWNENSGNAYGMYGTPGDSQAINASGYSAGLIRVLNKGNGNAYGMFGPNIANIRTTGFNWVHATIDLRNYDNGNIFGMYGDGIINNGSGSDGYGGEINLQNFAGGDAIGIYTDGGTVENTGYININNIGTGTGIGIFGDTGSTISNSGTITITRSNYTDTTGDEPVTYIPTNTVGNVYGIYAKTGGTVHNYGTINISYPDDNAYGIYLEGPGNISNHGTITINGELCNDADCGGHFIVLNGGFLYNSGLMMAPQMNLNSMGGNVVAGLGSQFVVDNELSGNLNISSELVQSGNQTTYIAENMIDAGDASGLHVRSASAMFNASLADNGHDVVMQMKDFNELTDNASLAAFLANNYANGKGQDLFSTLKSIDTSATFTSALGGLTGLNTFTQFAHEDLSAMREISFSMNNKLFENSSRDSFDISDSTGYFSFSNDHNGGSGQYGISSEKIAENWKLGYGMAMANINTGNGDSMHRQNNLWLFYMPATYTNDDIELVIAPKAGFAHSEYNRRGYNNINYDGYIEKRIFGLMNDLRYPLNFGNWTFAPDLAFNAIVYDQSGHEDEQAFSLVIPDDRTVSVETGLGFYTKYEKTLQDGSRFRLNSGLMVYREFGDTYDIKLGMRGMDGTFSLYNNYYEYRGAVSLGFDYMAGHLHLYGNAQYFMDNDNYMNFKGGISYRF